MKKRIRLQGFFIFLAVIALILLSKFICPHWKNQALETLLDALGVGAVLFGFLFRISARGLKAEKSGEGSRLVREGLYELVRHPMYFGTFLIGTGIVMVLFQWWIFLIFSAVFFSIYIPQTGKEARYLSERFGQEYSIYCKKVPRFFPSIFRKDIRDYLFFKWEWIKKELQSLIAAGAIIIIMETWQDARLFGYSQILKEAAELSLSIVFFAAIIILFKKKEKGT